MKRMAELALGARYPARLMKALHRCQDDPAAVRNVGIHWATEQCRDLLDNGVRGIHLYTLNKSDATRQIYQSLGLRDSTVVRKNIASRFGSPGGSRHSWSRNSSIVRPMRA